MRSLLPIVLLASTALAAYPTSGGSGASRWKLRNFKSLLTFGDSYTDENRLGYFVSHDGAAPPTGTYFNESLAASSGGRTWPRYVIQYTGSTVRSVWKPAVTLYNYAVSGAVCSNNLSPRFFSSINAPFPDLDTYAVPAFVADAARGVRNLATGRPYFEPRLSASNAVYAIWDGTNDLGNYAFLTDSQAAGKTLVDFSNCIFRQIDRLYKAGGRFFVLMNIVPLDKAPLYAKLGQGGVEASRFWTDKPEDFGGNVTLSEEKMREQIALVNDVWRYKLPYEARLANRYPGANFALYDVHQLIEDIIASPSKYLNGTSPLNVQNPYLRCNPDGSSCPTTGDPDSYLWYDELHPSEQTDRIVAREFVNVISGKGKYATYI